MKKIKVENLKIGDCIKNYKILCEILDQPVYSGNQKMNQLEEFKRYFNFDKVGVKFYITDIYETPIKKEYKYPVNVVYTNHIESILLQYLSMCKNKKAIISTQSLLLELGMVNQNFVDISQGKRLSSDLFPEYIDIKQIDNFHRRCNTRIYNILKKSLDSMEKRKLITCSKGFLIKYKNSNEYTVATPEEEALICKISDETLSQAGLKRIEQVYLNDLSSIKFFRKRNKKLSEIANIESVCRCWKIRLVHKDNATHSSASDIMAQKEMLNNKIIETINKQAVNAYEKHCKSQKELIEFNGISTLNSYERYIDVQKILAEKLLKI